MSTKTHLVMGLQASGKTTFAAALWYLVDMGEVETALLKGKHSGEFRYLEEIAQYWAEGWKVPRTDSNRVEHVRINLRHAGSETDVALEFADLSGETYERAFETRLAGAEFLELLQRMDGLLLFVSANRVVDGVTIADTAARMPALAVAEAESEAEPEREWSPTDTPHQVQLVDLLQIISQPPHGKRPGRVVVIISAWDLSPEPDPDNWLSSRMPLLDQMLRAHQHDIPYRVYGVSAQGGCLPSKDQPGVESDRAELLMYALPSTRIRVVGHGAGPHDLTHPIRWLSLLEPPDGAH
jgi:hypothetical protein